MKEKLSNENEYIPYTPESKYLSIAREMKKISDEENGLLPKEKGLFDKAEERFISLAREIEKAGQSGELYPEDKEKWWDRFKDHLKTYKRFTMKAVRVGVLTGVLMNTMPATNITEKVEEKPNVPKVEEVVKIKKEQSNIKQETPWYKGWRLNQVVIEKDKDGKLYFNPLKLIAPVQLEKVSDQKTINNFKFSIPYEYARLFNSAKPLNSEDHEKVKKYISNELNKVFEDKIRGLNFSIETEQEINKDKKHPEIEKISVSGFASPEGLNQKGPETIEKGNIDKENIELARLRAEKALEITLEDLEKIGIPKDSVDKVLKEIKVEETQFSTEEFAKLTVLSKDWQGATPLEKIFNMIVDYNDGKINNPEIVKNLHEILASKRKIEIEGAFKANEKNIYSVPLPLLLCLLPFIRKRERRNEDNEKNNGQQDKQDKQEKEDLNKQEDKNFKKELINVEPLPVKPEDDEQFPEKIKISLCDGLYNFFDHPDTIRRGLNYRALCDEVNNNFEKFSSDNDREQYLTRKILYAWKEHDIIARREAGWSEENIAQGLDYENQPNQIYWALAHAKVLLRLIKEKRSFDQNGQSIDYINLMSKDIENYMNEKLNMPEEKTKKDWLKTSVELAMEGRIAWEKD